MESTSTLINEFLRLPSVAVVGISSNRQTIANAVYKKLRNGRRTVYAVGRNSSSFDGDQCYPDLASLPAPANGVFIAARPENVEQLIDDCIAGNIERVWIHNIQKCRDHGIALIPGACPMMFVDDADVGHRCIKWFLSVTGRLN
jgi:predicted CoA-binding protein